jgi:type I restriction enzyme R subunit
VAAFTSALSRYRHQADETSRPLFRANPTRARAFPTKFETLIESCNAGSRNIDALFKELLALSRSLSQEEQRHVREQLTEDELQCSTSSPGPAPI